jgi:Predicted membrane protein (DUF2127)
MPDATPSEQLLGQILGELKELRKSFDERNRLIDAQLANSQQFNQQNPATDPAAVEDLQRRDLQRQARENTESYVKIITALYDKGTAYTNLLLIGGYASFFALWTNTRPLITTNQARWAAILMLISASIFVIFEVYKMLQNTAHLVRYQRILQQNIENEANPAVINEAFREYDHAYNQRRNRLIIPWFISNCFAVPTALIAVSILLCGFISGLF